MKENEKKLFKELCSFKNDVYDESLLVYATPSVLGQLFFNRMQGIAYGTLKKRNQLGEVNREFRTSLGGAYAQNLQKNHSYLNCVKMLSEIFASCGCPIAMLKGAYLCAYYPEGYRTSNDIDLLVLPQDVTVIGNLLTMEGFVRGNIRNGEFIPASRREIVESKMMRGETVPYIKEVNLPDMRFLEVDINFSLDYKSGDTDLLVDMLSKVSTKQVNDILIPTLEDSDFFLHLCAHLYKEATTYPWIAMRRDMTLYKYCDIYLLLSEMSEWAVNRLFDRAKELGLEKICAYAILETGELFDLKADYACMMARNTLKGSSDFCLRVVSPQDKKIYIYQTPDATSRLFMNDRTKDLKEVKINERTQYA